MNEGDELELTTFQQLYIQVLESKVGFVKGKFKEVEWSCYPVGDFANSLRICNFCKGEEEGMIKSKRESKRSGGHPSHSRDRRSGLQCRRSGGVWTGAYYAFFGFGITISSPFWP